MYISDRRMIMLLQDLFNDKKEDWSAAIEPVIKDFVAKLPDNIRKVLEMRYGLDCDVGCQQIPQIAQGLNILQTDVQGFLTRGYQAIRKFLADYRFNIVKLTPDQAVTQVIKERERMIPYRLGENHTVDELPTEFFETYRLDKFGLSNQAHQYLESLHIFLVGEIVVARPQEIELSANCTDRVRLEIRTMLQKFDLKRGMNIAYEDFTNLLSKRREQEIMELSVAVTYSSMEHDLKNMFDESEKPPSKKKKK